ncbi:uncharacterized protein LOC144667188 [Oculina patagonica]
MEAFVGKILPSLLIIVLMTFSAEAERVSMEKNESGSSGRTLSSKNNTRDDCNQDGTEIRRMIQYPYERPCYAQFFVGGRQPEGLRTGNDNLKYICQPPNQQVQQTFYATMFDERYGIAVFSAYKLTQANAYFPGGRKYGVVQWTQTPGVQPQGSDALYNGRKQEIRGHLAPANIFSNNAQRYASTFTYTNHVPQKNKFNNGLWKTFEYRIRGYARRCTQVQQQGQQVQDSGILYLLTGTSFMRVGGQQGNPQSIAEDIKGIPRNNPTVKIPNSLWTAGCCVRPSDQHTESFAVIGNNVQPANQQLTWQVRVEQLQNILAADVHRHGLSNQNVLLFPGNQNCLRNTQQNL